MRPTGYDPKRILVAIVIRMLGKVWEQFSDPRAAIPWELCKG